MLVKILDSIDNNVLTRVIGKSSAQQVFEYYLPSNIEKCTYRIRFLTNQIATLMQAKGAIDYWTNGYVLELGDRCIEILETDIQAKVFWNEILALTGVVDGLLGRGSYCDFEAYRIGYQSGLLHRANQDGNHSLIPIFKQLELLQN